MDKSLNLYFESLIKKYGSQIEIIDPIPNDDKLSNIPVALQALYKFASGIKLPFGQIYTLEKALEQSERVPFKPNWFVFGKDNYFSFWICSFREDSDGLSFTYWDHESGNDIDGAVWEDIVSFLKEMEEEYETN